MLEKEYAFYSEHRAELIKRYQGRFLVIKGDKILGDYATQEEALATALKDNAPGTFMIQECTEDADQVMRFSSRVTFPHHVTA
jgi:hypothetical protein